MAEIRMTCKKYCVCWNDIDKDCELYGENHPCPRKCEHFLKEVEELKKQNLLLSIANAELQDRFYSMKEVKK